MIQRASRERNFQPPEFVHWPDGYTPDDASVYAHNELIIPAAPDRIWEWLVRARQWPHWYPNSWRVEILKRTRRGTHREQLSSGTKFTWITFGLPIQATVDPCEKPTTIGWKFETRWWAGAARGYHIWFIEPHPHGCRVVTEETELGLLPRLLRFILQSAVPFSHQLWLQRLSKNAIQGPPL